MCVYVCQAGRAKNVRNILLKNTVDVLLAALAWWALGFAFAYGKSAAGFIG
jgi:ammonia channel protein AmtB